jgi:hypothetical protein
VNPVTRVGTHILGLLCALLGSAMLTHGNIPYALGFFIYASLLAYMLYRADKENEE